MDIDLEHWPAQGRVGLATAGDFAGNYVFVFSEEGWWGFYTADGVDDMLPDDEFLRLRLEAAAVEWLEPDEDAIVERELFAMRPLKSQLYPDQSFKARFKKRRT